MTPLPADGDATLSDIAYRIARSTRAAGGKILTDDERQQAAAIGMWEAYQSFDPIHGVPVAQWARFKGFAAARHAITHERRRSGPTVQIRERHAVSDGINVGQIDLRRAVSSLDDPDKTVVVLLYQEGMTIREAGVELRVSVGTVMQIKDRAVSKLRVALGAA